MCAWDAHRLTREQERYHAIVVVDAVAAIGSDFREWPADAIASRDALVLDNLWLVIRHARRNVGKGLLFDDLIQYGVLGLFKSILKYVPIQGVRFPTYANTWIFQQIMRALDDAARLIRVPVHMLEAHRTIHRIYGEELVKDASPQEYALIAARTNYSPSTVRSALSIQDSLSLDTPAARRATAYIPSTLTPSIETDVIDKERNCEITTLLETLPARSADVLCRRFGLGEYDSQTLEQVAHVYGLSRERVRQIEAKALKDLYLQAYALQGTLEFSPRQARREVPSAVLPLQRTSLSARREVARQAAPQPAPDPASSDTISTAASDRVISEISLAAIANELLVDVVSITGTENTYVTRRSVETSADIAATVYRVIAIEHAFVEVFSVTVNEETSPNVFSEATTDGTLPEVLDVPLQTTVPLEIPLCTCQDDFSDPYNVDVSDLYKNTVLLDTTVRSGAWAYEIRDYLVHKRRVLSRFSHAERVILIDYLGAACSTPWPPEVTARKLRISVASVKDLSMVFEREMDACGAVWPFRSM